MFSRQQTSNIRKQTLYFMSRVVQKDVLAGDLFGKVYKNIQKHIK